MPSKSTKQSEKPYANGTLTESGYLSWIRSALRSRWLRWPPRAAALDAAKEPYVGDNARRKHSYRCKLCNGLFALKDCEVDHYPHDAGAIRSLDDIGPFVGRLFCETDNLRVLCKNCHAIYTYSQRQGISWELAMAEKKAIQFVKDNTKEEVLAYLHTRGYNVGSLTNADKRRQALVEVFMKEDV